MCTCVHVCTCVHMCVCAACTLTSRAFKLPGCWGVCSATAVPVKWEGSPLALSRQEAPPGTSQAPVTHSAWSWQRPPATITAAPHFSEAVMLNQSIRCATRRSSAVDSLRTCAGSNHYISGLPCSFIWVQFTWWSHYISVLRKVFLPLWLCTALGKSITPRQATNPLKCTHTEMHCPDIKGASSPRYTESRTHPERWSSCWSQGSDLNKEPGEIQWQMTRSITRVPSCKHASHSR